MLKKVSIIISVLAALGFAATAPASAREVHKNVRVNRTVHVNKTVHVNRNVHVNRSVHSNFVIGRRYNGHYWYGQNRHRWHGVWYEYGVGPCWINVDGLWFWNVAACP
jgi:hypothetical protein